MQPLLSGLPNRKFRVGLADVPWKYVVRSKKGLGRSAERHYDTMTLDEITALPVERCFARDAHLFFCVTGPFMVIGAHIPIMQAWGFEPTAMAFVWIKPVRKHYENGALFIDDDLFKMGPGHTTRQNAEYVVLGRRGSPPTRLSRSIRQVIVEPAREHSRKPEKLYEGIERYAPGPRLELFGRMQRPGWTVRGDQVGKFEAPP